MINHFENQFSIFMTGIFRSIKKTRKKIDNKLNKQMTTTTIAKNDLDIDCHNGFCQQKKKN